jgi:matrixin
MKQTIRRFLPVAVALIATVWVFRTDVVGYVSSGHAWATNQVPYYVNPSNIYVSNSAAISAFQAGALPWTSQTLANIQLVYAGTTNGSSITLNNKNEVFFRNDSSSYVAETYWWYDGTGHLVDADMMLHENNHFYAGSGCTGAGVYIEDVAVHEFGHALGLNHSTVLGATMYPTMPGYCDMTQMSLESDDISGIESLYPPTSTSKNTAPTVSISAPGNGASFANGATISFAGSASDSQDGNVTSSIAWTSSIDGAIGSGGSFSRVLSAGSHVITASVRDSGGLTGTKQITISVAAASSSSSSSSGPSPDGTMVPTTASQIVDNAGNIWTIGSNQLILMTAPNGSQSANGSGSKIYWKSSTIYVYGTDGNWYQWTGSGWRNVGSATPGGTTTTTSTTTVSPDGTMVPTTASQIMDNAGNIWTIGSNQLILMTAPNGVQTTNGTGSKIYWKSSTIYVYGTDGNWYQWTGSGWRNVGSTTPGGTTTTTSTTTVSPDGTMVPTTASQILDNAGNIWTIGSNQMVLVTTPNGVQSFYGSGSKIYWKSSTIYVYGTDANWYRWTGSGWVNIGPIQP